MDSTTQPVPSAAEADVTERIGDEAALFARDPDAPKTAKVDLGKKGTFIVGKLTPQQNAEVNEQCYEDVPDINGPTGATKQVYRAFQRQFFLVARALRNPDGSRMFKSKSLPDTAWLAGANKISTMLDQWEINLLAAAANKLLGFDTQEKVDRAGKGLSVSQDDSGS